MEDCYNPLLPIGWQQAITLTAGLGLYPGEAAETLLRDVFYRTYIALSAHL
jgi:hypothetical protein